MFQSHAARCQQRTRPVSQGSRLRCRKKIRACGGPYSPFVNRLTAAPPLGIIKRMGLFASFAVKSETSWEATLRYQNPMEAALFDSRACALAKPLFCRRKNRALEKLLALFVTFRGRFPPRLLRLSPAGIGAFLKKPRPQRLQRKACSTICFPRLADLASRLFLRCGRFAAFSACGQDGRSSGFSHISLVRFLKIKHRI